jgi:hypothetical protein
MKDGERLVERVNGVPLLYNTRSRVHLNLPSRHSIFPRISPLHELFSLLIALHFLCHVISRTQATLASSFSLSNSSCTCYY